MPKDMAAMDLIALLQELRVLEEARIDKFYQRGHELIVHAYKPGDKKYRLFTTGGRAFLTDYKREMPQRPPGFCMALRKQLGGAVIERVELPVFDRVLELHTEEHVLVFELFNEGNVILTNKGGEILRIMDAGTVLGRDLYPGEEYTYPADPAPPGDVDEITADEPAETDVVVALAAGMSLGGRYAEEVCSRAGVDKSTPVADLTAADEEAVLDALHGLHDTLQAGELEPHVYSDADGPLVATPVPFGTFQDHDSEAYDSFSRALDTYFTEAEKAEERREQRQAYRERKEKLERRLEQQERKMEGLETAVEENQAKGDLIYEHYGLVEEVLDSVRSARQQYSEDEMRERLESEQAQGVPAAEAIVRLDLGNEAVVVDLDGEEVRLDLSTGVEENAERFYEKGKQSRQKREGLEDALRETRRELERLEPEDVDVEDRFENKRRRKEERNWYEKFRWTWSSDGYLIIAGRDTTTNDMVVKKYMEPHDVYVHAEFQGAPSVVVRTEGDEDVPGSTLEEAGQVAVTYAKAWQAGVTSEDAYHVSPEQVTQEPESGEYLPKGSFVIRGDRTYLRNLPVAAAVGLYQDKDRVVPMGGPPSAVRTHCDHYVTLEQGGDQPSDVAKQIRDHFNEYTEQRLDVDAIIRALPPGDCRVAERH